MMLRAVVLRIALFVIIWWVLTEGRIDSWGVGAVSVIGAVTASLLLLPPPTSRLSLAGVPGFLGFFLYRSMKGGIQVALMALRPRPDLRPRMLEIPLRLPEGAAQVFLAALMSLLPGTLSAGLDNNRLRLHVLDARRPVEHDLRIAEARIARLFGMELQ